MSNVCIQVFFCGEKKARWEKKGVSCWGGEGWEERGRGMGGEGWEGWEERGRRGGRRGVNCYMWSIQ